MKNKMMLGLWRFMLGVPSFLWEKEIGRAKDRLERRFGFLTPDHRRVHHFTVRELPTFGGPLTPERIAEGLDLPLDRVKALLDDLEKNMTFLVRNDQGRVIWAFPVTVEPTPHRLVFDSGETVYAA